MKQEMVRATEAEVEQYLEILNKSKNGQRWAVMEAKYLRMSDDELYHHFMDNPVTDHGSFQVIYHESGEVPRLFKRGKKFISMGVPLRELKK